MFKVRKNPMATQTAITAPGGAREAPTATAAPSGRGENGDARRTAPAPEFSIWRGASGGSFATDDGAEEAPLFAACSAGFAKDQADAMEDCGATGACSGSGFVGGPPVKYPVECVLAFDIEKTGQRTDQHSMVALGGCVVRVRDSKVMSSFLCFMKLEPGHRYDPLCKSEYWDNWIKFPMNRVVLERIANEGVAPEVGIRDFAAWLDSQERHYEERGEKLAVVVDTVGSDTTWVSHYFQKYLNRGPIEDQYGNPGRYRSIKHSTAYARGIAGDDGSREVDWRRVLRARGVALPPDDMHNHMPDSDARSIATTYAACLRHVHDARVAQGAPADPFVPFSKFSF